MLSNASEMGGGLFIESLSEYTVVSGLFYFHRAPIDECAH